MPNIPNGDVATANGGLHTEAGVIPIFMDNPPGIAGVQGYIDGPRNVFNLSLLFTVGQKG
jgi:hypothetical protein